MFLSPVVSLSDVTAHITSPSVTSPVSTAAKIIIQSSTKTTMASSEPEIAFPAVLKGSKQRVPPPVPPRGSPKPKRGGATSYSSLDTKGEQLTISVTDIPAQTPFTSSEEDFSSYGYDFNILLPESTVACRIPPSVSEKSVKVTDLASNSFLDYVEEADSITERSHPAKDLIAQTTLMAKFNVDKTIREHLDSGDYDDASFTDTSSEEQIVIHELVDEEVIEVKTRKVKSPSQYIKGVVTSIGDKLTRKTPVESDVPHERASVHNVKSSDLVFAANTLKKTPKSQTSPEIVKEVIKADKNEAKPTGIISGLSRKLNFNQSKRDKNRKVEEPKKPKPKVEIKTYNEEHSRGMTKDEVICHRKAKNKIDMFQKHIWKVQSDSENSSRRSSLSSSQEMKTSFSKPKKINVVKRRSSDLVQETKKIFEPIEFKHGSTSSIDKKSNLTYQTTTYKPVISKSISGNVHEKIKKFSEGPSKSDNPPVKIPRQKKESKRRSFKRKSVKKTILKMKKDVEDVL